MNSDRTEPEISASMLLFVDAPITLNALTSARPIMSAEAVAAVRRGFRTAFSCARRPVVPQIRGSTAPTLRRNGRARTGLSAVAPRMRRRAPRPTSDAPVPPSSESVPPTRASAPAPASTEPTTVRRPRPRCTPATSSRIAATGGVRAARRAGT